MSQKRSAGLAFPIGCVVAAVAFIGAGCADGTATPQVAASPATSQTSKAPQADPSLAVARNIDKTICTDLLAAYKKLRDNTAAVTAVALAATKDGKPKEAAAALHTLIVGYQSVVTKQLSAVQSQELKTALGMDAVFTGMLIKQLDEAGSNGAKVADVILTAQWRALGQAMLVACTKH